MLHAAPPRRLGGIAELKVADLVAAAGFMVAILGSVGPWISSPLMSPSGLSGDGKLTAAVAALGMLLMVMGSFGRLLSAITAAACAGLGIHEWVHIHNTLGRVIILGVADGSVGWGVYAVGVGGLIAAAAAMWSYVEG